mmetsp:Transcript_174092/g.558173  ORF Transcript_174092/g.558173 Transcript_174092/m.558173 type:complete len:291 (+) Transcript_174092:94-966(+)
MHCPGLEEREARTPLANPGGGRTCSELHGGLRPALQASCPMSRTPASASRKHPRRGGTGHGRRLAAQWAAHVLVAAARACGDCGLCALRVERMTAPEGNHRRHQRAQGLHGIGAALKRRDVRGLLREGIQADAADLAPGEEDAIGHRGEDVPQGLGLSDVRQRALWPLSATVGVVTGRGSSRCLRHCGPCASRRRRHQRAHCFGVLDGPGQQVRQREVCRDRGAEAEGLPQVQHGCGNHQRFRRCTQDQDHLAPSPLPEHRAPGRCVDRTVPPWPQARGAREPAAARASV